MIISKRFSSNIVIVFAVITGIALAAAGSWYALERATKGTTRRGSGRIKTISSSVLFTIPESHGNPDDRYFIFSPDHKRVAYPVRQEDGQFASWDGREGEKFPEVSDLRFSPDGKHFVYRAFENGQWFYFIDGEPQRRYEGIGIPVFSPDGKIFSYVAFSARKGWQFMVTHDLDAFRPGGQEGSFYEGVWGITFSRSAAHVAYAARSGEEAGKLFVVRDGIGQKPYEAKWIDNIVFRPDEEELAYAVLQGEAGSLVVQGERESPRYDGVGFVMYSPDGAHLAHVAAREGESFVVIDGEEKYCCYDIVNNRIQIWSPVWSADGKNFAFAGGKGGGHLTVRNGEEGQTYDNVQNLVFSPDGQKLAYMAATFDQSEERKKWFIVVNGKEGVHHDNVWKPAFSPDGKKLAHIAELEGKQFVAMADVARGAYERVKEGTRYDKVWDIEFSPDGKTITYNARMGREIWLIIDQVK